MEKTVSRQVYVVDDDDAVRDSLCAVLDSHGYTVRAFPSAQAFLDAMPAQPQGCLILDLHMPGMSGVELLERLRALRVALPVIMMTGRSDPQLKDRATRLGALVLLDKPIDGEVLTAMLARALALA